MTARDPQTLLSATVGTTSRTHETTQLEHPWPPLSLPMPLLYLVNLPPLNILSTAHNRHIRTCMCSRMRPATQDVWHRLVFPFAITHLSLKFCQKLMPAPSPTNGT